MWKRCEIISFWCLNNAIDIVIMAESRYVKCIYRNDWIMNYLQHINLLSTHFSSSNLYCMDKYKKIKYNIYSYIISIFCWKNSVQHNTNNGRCRRMNQIPTMAVVGAWIKNQHPYLFSLPRKILRYKTKLWNLYQKHVMHQIMNKKCSKRIQGKRSF